MTDRITALEARDQWLYIAHHWAPLQAALGGRGGQALTGMPSAASPDPAAVIDLHVSDLLHEITSIVRYYARILEGETTWKPATSHMPALLVDVASRYGHFTSDADTSHGFTDDAHTLSERVRKTLNPTARPTYIGPCQVQNCEGELRLREDQEHARCPTCGTVTTINEQRMWLYTQMAERLMTPAELVRGLKSLGYDVQPGTVFKWVQREKIRPVEEGLFRFSDAVEYVSTRRVAA